MLQGTLFKYGPGSAHIGFQSQPKATCHVILIGGLTDGLLFAPYAELLNTRLAEANISLVQPMLQSSLTGWGIASLDQDAADIHLLAKTLCQDYNSQGIVIIGHSTGCQDAVRYAATYIDTTPPLLGVILQAPVSDREYLATLPETEGKIKLAQALADQGRGREIAFRQYEFDGAPISADRWLSLTTRLGDDDMFSSDLSDAELTERLQGLKTVPTLILLSGADEYVPESVDYRALGIRMADAIGGDKAQVEVVDGALHNLLGHEEQGVGVMMQFLLASVFLVIRK